MPPEQTPVQTHASLLTLTQAWECIAAQPACTETVALPIADCAYHVLAADLVAEVDHPAHSVAAMDGYAFASATQPEKQSLELVGRAEAGNPYRGATVSRGQCVRIFTGAIIPAGCDTVAMQEDCTTTQNTKNTRATHRNRVHVPAQPKGNFIRPQGSDVVRGTTLAQQGSPLNPRDIAVALACGISQTHVCRPLRVAVLATGSELRTAQQIHSADQTTLNANMPAVAAALRHAAVCVNDLGIAADTHDDLRHKIHQGLESDLLILSGGVSVGEKDLVRSVLLDMGADIIFHGLLLKPGKPSLFARIGKTLVLGLPGNPVSAMVGAQLLAKPILARLAGQLNCIPKPRYARCAESLPQGRARQNFLRGIADHDQHGQLWVRPLVHQDSAALHTLAQSNALISIGINDTARQTGDVVPIYPFDGCF